MTQFPKVDAGSRVAAQLGHEPELPTHESDTEPAAAPAIPGALFTDGVPRQIVEARALRQQLLQSANALLESIHATPSENLLSVQSRMGALIKAIDEAQEGLTPLSSSSAAAGVDAQVDLQETMGELLGAITDMQVSVQLDDMPPWLPEGTRREFLRRFQEMEVSYDPQGDAFEMSIDEGWLKIGKGLLGAFEGLDRESWGRLGVLLVLHETFHSFQNIDSFRYHGVGRACEGLEVIDYEADAAAIGVAIAKELREAKIQDMDPKSLRHATAQVGARWFETSLMGIEAFDRFEQGDRITNLADRRLQRYMIWHLNLSAVKTARRPDNIWKLLSEKPTIKLGRTNGYCGPRRGDKFVTSPKDQSELFLTLRSAKGPHGMRRLRVKEDSNFRPGDIIEAVRDYDRERLQDLFGYVRSQYRAQIVPWTMGA